MIRRFIGVKNFLVFSVNDDFLAASCGVCTAFGASCVTRNASATLCAF